MSRVGGPSARQECHRRIWRRMANRSIAGQRGRPRCLTCIITSCGRPDLLYRYFMGNELNGYVSERRRQRAIWLLSIVSIALIGTVQRDHRQFLAPDRPPASAFAAIVPPPAEGAAGVPGLLAGGLSPFGGESRRRRARLPVGGTGPGGAAAFGVAHELGATGSGSAAPVGPSDSVEVAAIDTGLTPKVGVGASDGGSGVGGGDAVQPIGTGPLAGGGAVGAVPEPSTWMMLILGIGGVGTLLRRRRRVKSACGPVAAARQSVFD